MKTGDNNGLKRKEDVILTCKGSLKVDILGLILEEATVNRNSGSSLSFQTLQICGFFLINVISSPIQQLKHSYHILILVGNRRKWEIKRVLTSYLALV